MFGLNSAQSGSSNKFFVGDTAIFIDKGAGTAYSVDILTPLFNGAWSYECRASHIRGNIHCLESDLMTLHEWSIHVQSQHSAIGGRSWPKFNVGDRAIYCDPKKQVSAFEVTINKAVINANNSYTYDCTPLNSFQTCQIDEDYLMTPQEYQAHLMGASVAMQSTKFKPNDTAFYSDPNSTNTVEVMVSKVFYHNNQLFYDLSLKASYVTFYDVPESQLMTPIEYVQGQGRSNRIPNGTIQVHNSGIGLAQVAAMRQSFNDSISKADTFKTSHMRPKCECGAHKVKDSAHAQWCDMAKVSL